MVPLACRFIPRWCFAKELDLAEDVKSSPRSKREQIDHETRPPREAKNDIDAVNSVCPGWFFISCEESST